MLKWRVRIRRVLVVTTTFVVLAASALIPVAVFSAPVPRPAASGPPDADGLIPWELSGAIWSECPMSFAAPDGFGLGWWSDETGEWQVTLYNEKGVDVPQEEIAASFPELVEPLEAFHECLDRFPTAPYREPPSLNPAQREMVWAYVLSNLAPCLRDHDRVVELPSRRVFASTDITQWYLETLGAWDGSAPLDELLTVWRECPMLPSYLEQPPADGVTADVVTADVVQGG